MSEHLLNNAPVMKYSPKDGERMLRQIVSWYPEEDRPVQAREFIATNFSDEVSRINLKLDIPRAKKPFLKVSQLSPEDQIKVTLAQRGQDNEKHGLAMGRVYSYEEVIDAVRNSRGIGPELVRMNVDGIEFFLHLVEHGKIIIDEYAQDSKPLEFSS